MSYSNLIQKDNPAIVWSLDETSGTIVNPDRFLYTIETGGSFYAGTYSNIERIGFPLVYGGQQAIKILSNGQVQVPSLDKLSIKDSRNDSSIEFWIKVDKSGNTNKVIMSKPGNYNTKIYINNDYMVFRIGIATKYYEVSTPIDSVNKVLHVVASYTPSSISLIVNGISRTKTIKDPDSLFPSYVSGDEKFNFIGSDFSNIQIDCISLYSYVLPRERALKHFVYGSGYSLPSELINSNSGVFYNFSMDGHKEINKYDMGPGNGWSITSANNCLIQDGILTIKTKQEPKTYYAEGYYEKNFPLLFQDSKYSFIKGLYLEIESINSIIPESLGGWAAKFIGGTYSANKKILMSIGSRSSQNYIEIYTILDNGTNKIIIDINEELTTLKSSHTLSTAFYIGYYRGLSSDSIFFLPSAGDATIINLSVPQITSAYARFGSDNIWFDGEDISNISENLGISDTNLLKIVGIHKDNENLFDTYSKIEGSDFKHYYTAVPNSEERRFKIQSYAQAVIDIDQQFLCPPQSEVTGACRIEIGSPVNSQSILMSLDEKKYKTGSADQSTSIYTNDYINRVITSGALINKKTTQAEDPSTNPVDSLSFTFTLKTEDLIDRPPLLNYFRIASYALNYDDHDYILNNSSPGGNPAKIYLSSTDNECNIPDIIEMPFFYNGFNSGLKLNKSYAKINHNFTAIQPFVEISGATKGTTTTYTVKDNIFKVNDLVTVSDLSDSIFNFSDAKSIASINESNKTITVNHNSSAAASNLSNQEGYAQTPSGISSVMFMCYIPKQTTGTALKVIRIGDKQFTINSNTGTIVTASGSTAYVNGVVYNSTSNLGKLDQWQNITIVFDSPILVIDQLNTESGVDVILGDSSNSTELYIDQLMIFDKKLTTNSGIGSLDNIYNAFIGKEVSGYKVEDGVGSKVTLVDNNYSTASTLESKYYCDYYYPEVVTSQIYTTLTSGIFENKTLTLTYANTIGKNSNITVSATKASAATDNFLYLSSFEGIYVGSKLLKVGSASKNIAVSSLTDAVTKQISTSVSKKSPAKKAKTVNITLSLNNTSGIQKGDTVTSNIYYTDSKKKKHLAIPASSKVIKVSSSSVVVQMPSPGLMKSLPVGTDIIFNPDPSNNRLVLASDVGTAVSKKTTITFNNKVVDDNILLNSQLKISGNYITTGKKILINNPGDVRLYEISSPVDSNVKNDGSSVSILFKKIPLSESLIYQIDNKKYKYIDSNLYEFSKTQTIERFTYKLAPQYAITE